MEQRPERQPLSTPATATSPSGASAPVRPRPSRSNIVLRTLRLLLRRIMYGAMIIGRPLARFAPFLVLIIVLLGVIGWLSYMLLAPRPGVVADSRVALLAPSTAVENYIRGQQNYNAELMWSSLSTDLQAQQLQSGASKQALQSRVDQKREQGLRFGRYDYLGGMQLENGDSMFSYIVDVQATNEQVQFPMTFVVDKDGKVTGIISSSLLSDISIPTEE